MSTQSPLPQNDPMLIAFQKLKKTPEYQNAVKWTIKAENESQADGELWFAFLAGYDWTAGYQSGGNYTANDSTFPTEITFQNGRKVGIAFDGDKPYLTVGIVE